MPRPSWIPKLLAAMGWPDDPATSLALDLWSLSEDRTYQMQNQCHNYIAIIWPPGNRPPWNSFKCGSSTCHVQCYASEDEGVNATKRFLEQSSFSLLDQAMLAPFQPKWKIENIYLRINAGGFCGGCQGGHYPVVLYNWLYRRRGQLPSPYLDSNTPPPPRASVPVNIFTAWHDLMHQFRVTLPFVIRKLHAESLALRKLGK